MIPNPQAREANRQAYLQASEMRLGRPASAPAFRQAVPVTPLELLRARSRPTSAWVDLKKEAATKTVEATVVDEGRPQSEAAPQTSEVPCSCAEVSQSSLVSTQQPLHSEPSEELDVPEEECDDANEAELQGRVEALRRKDLQEKLMKLQQQQKELEEEQQEVQKLLQRTPTRRGVRPRSSGAPKRSNPGSAAQLRIDGKAISGPSSRTTSAKTRPSSSPGGLRRSQSATGIPESRQNHRPSLRDVHYESMRRQAAERLDLLKQREIQREPWTHGGSRPARPWSAIPGYTGYRPHREEDSMVGRNWSQASLQCIRLYGKPPQPPR